MYILHTHAAWRLSLASAINTYVCIFLFARLFEPSVEMKERSLCLRLPPRQYCTPCDHIDCQVIDTSCRVCFHHLSTSAILQYFSMQPEFIVFSKLVYKKLNSVASYFHYFFAIKTPEMRWHQLIQTIAKDTFANNVKLEIYPLNFEHSSNCLYLKKKSI